MEFIFTYLNNEIYFSISLLSILQVLLLPGFLIVGPFLKKAPIERIILFSICISLLANYLISFFLLISGLFTQGILLLLFFIELTFLASTYKRFYSNVLGSISLIDFISSLTMPNHPSDKISHLNVISKLVSLVSLSTLFYISWLTYNQVGTVFSTWDALCSWNLWAVNLAKNNGLIGMWGGGGVHPPLLPLNLALSYVFSGTTEVEFFTKTIRNPVGILAI